MWRMLVVSTAAVIAGVALACGSGSDGGPSDSATLALTSADCKISSMEPIAGCHGMVKNLTSDNASGLFVMVAWLDADGNVMFKSNAQPIYGVILAGAEAQWDVASDYDPNAKDYRVEFLNSEGKPIPTLDQRPE